MVKPLHPQLTWANVALFLTLVYELDSASVVSPKTTEVHAKLAL